jgi:hypothetical protein
MNNYLTLLLIVFVVVQLSQAQNICPVTTKPHSTECNKYLKCIDSNNNTIRWAVMKCEEGLVYDKHLLSCAIPNEKFDCLNDDDTSSSDSSHEFLEVINDEFQIKSTKSSSKSDFFDENDDVEDSSGDGINDLHAAVTSSPSTVRMITTQLQRLTQLVKHAQDEHNGVVRNELTPNELNTFLSVQKIQTSPPNSASFVDGNGKTPMSHNGKIHPEILSNILDQQNELNNKLTTLSMDESTTATIPVVNPIQFLKKKTPLASINLESREGYGGSPHQIIVNRPEGSVLFNVPSDHQKISPSTPFLSGDILRSIFEISKHMAKQQNQQVKQSPPQTIPHPIYYAVPVPIYYGNNSTANFPNNPMKLDTSIQDEIPTQNENVKIIANNKSNNNKKEKKKKKTSDKFIVANDKSQSSTSSLEYETKLKNYQQQQQQQQIAYQNYLNNQNYLYKPYQQQQQQQLPYQQPFNYQQYPFASNYPSSFSYGNQENGGFDNSFSYGYGVNRPFVIESSAPTSSSLYDYYKPKRESYETSSSFESSNLNDEKNAEGDYDNREGGEILYDFNDSSSREDDEKPMKPQKEKLICSVFLQRQANKTNCFKYYVCNAKTKEVIDYTCPAYTSFNDVSKYCDAESYQNCKKITEAKFQSQQNQKIYNEAQAALEQVKRQSQKVERIANRMKQESQKIHNSKRKTRYPGVSRYGEESSIENEDEDVNSYSSYYQPQNFAHYQRMPVIQKTTQKPPTRKTTKLINSVSVVKLTRPTTVSKTSKRKSTKKKRVKCNGTGNIPDPNSKNKYWHCFVDPNDKRMKRINRQCTGNFTFCPSKRFCTTESLCN